MKLLIPYFFACSSVVWPFTKEQLISMGEMGNGIFSFCRYSYSNVNVLKESQLPSLITFALKTYYYSTLCPLHTRNLHERATTKNEWNGKLCTSFSTIHVQQRVEIE